MLSELTLIQLITICCSAFIIGMSKTGIQGITVLSVPYMAMAFGAKESTGIILPLLCLADIIGVGYYRKTCDFKVVLRLLPAAVAGFFLAIFVDTQIPVAAFKQLLGGTLLLVFGVLLWSEYYGKDNRYAHTWWFAAFFGVLGGFVTMVANAAGAVMAVYLLSMRKAKNDFIGTNAWFFMIVNLLKLPLQIFAWNNIDWSIIKLDLCMLPCIFMGAALGFYLVKRFSDKSFKMYIQGVTALSVIMMLCS